MKCLLILALALAGPAAAQPAQSGSAATHGACSPAVSGNNNTFIIRCGIRADQGKRMLDILNKVLSNQIDPTSVMQKLDEIIASSRQQNQTVNAPNGIGNIGGTLVNPTVNNYGPPPAHISYTETDDLDMADASLIRPGFKLTKLTLTTDRAIPGAVVGVIASGAIEIRDAPSGASGGNGLPWPVFEGGITQEVDWHTAPALQKDGFAVPNSVSFTVVIPAAFAPGMKLVVIYRSKPDVHIIAAVPIS